MKKPHIRPRSQRRADAPLGTPWDIRQGPPAAHHGASTRNPSVAGWRPAGSGPNAVYASSGPELVRRSRDLRRNSAIARHALDLVGIHAIGTGIIPRSLCQNEKVRDALTQLWSDWVPYADADGALDFNGLQNLAVSELTEGGECFARLRPRRLSDGLPVPLQIQLIPTEQVPLDYTGADIALNVMQGIQRDAIGARVAYWMYRVNPNDVTIPGFPIDPSQLTSVPAQDVCHLYNVTRAGQLRGIPWLAASITRLKQVDDYFDAELLRKQLSAVFTGFLEQEVGESEPTVKDIAGRTKEKFDPQNPGPFFPVNPDGSIAMGFEPGRFQLLRPGQKMVFNSPADVGASFDPFLSANWRQVAASIGVLYEELAHDWSKSSDRTFRAEFNTFKRLVGQWQYNLIGAQFLIPIWRRFVDYAVASGAIKVPKSVSDVDLYRVALNPQRHAYMHVLQDVQAIGQELALGLTSRTAEIMERGDDPNTIDEQIKSDLERESALGISFPVAQSGGAGAGPSDSGRDTQQER